MERITLTYACGHQVAVTTAQALAVAPSGKTTLDIICLRCRFRRAGAPDCW